MADIQTLWHSMADDLSERLNDTFKAWATKAVIEAIGELQNRTYTWNTGNFTFATVIDQAEYEEGGGANNLPSDFLGVRGDNLWLVYLQQQATHGYHLPRIDLAEAQDVAVRYVSSQTPRWWHYDSGVFTLYPAPEAVHDVRGPYLKDLNNLTLTSDGSAWTFPSGSTTNAWLDPSKGEPMVRHLAKTKLLLAKLNSPQRAQQAMLQFDTARRAADRTHLVQSASSFVEPYL